MRRMRGRIENRPGPLRYRLRLAGQILAFTCVFSVAFGGPTWLWRSGWLGQFLADAGQHAVGASAEIGLTVQEIRVEGWVHTPRDDIRGALELRRGDPIMAFDPVELRTRLEALPWVARAAVERRLPDTVVIRLEERRPSALWQRNGKMTLLDDTGFPMLGVETKGYGHLPVLVGSDAPGSAAALFAMLAREPTLKKFVRAAVRVGERRWDVRLRNGVNVRLPEQDAEAAWARLAMLNREHQLLARDIMLIDMRLPGRLIVRTKPVVPRRPRAVEKST